MFYLGADRVSKYVKQSSDIRPFVWQLFGQTCFGFYSLFWYFIKQSILVKQSLFCQTCTILASWGRRGLSRNTGTHLTNLFTSIVSQPSTIFSQVIETDIVNFWELAMPVLPTIVLIMLSSADSMVSCQGRVGINLTKTDYFGKKKHVWQTNIISAKRLVLAR